LPDAQTRRIVREEQTCLETVLQHLAQRGGPAAVSSSVDYDAQLIELRDEIAVARLEDVPPLVEEMERVQRLAGRRRDVARGSVDARSPYFGRLVLEEQGRQREVLIGRTTYLDPESGLRIVDWRDAPVSRIYYRYREGEEYDEVFGDREVTGTVLRRRTVTILDGVLRRIMAPQATLARGPDGVWRELEENLAKLSGGQGTAPRPEQYRTKKLGVGDGADVVEDKHLKQITPLIDAHQFELITRSDSGLVVIQGGAGSGKTTIGLHRIAYLAYRNPRRFRTDRMLVVVFNQALARYVSELLPALGVQGVAIRTYEQWSSRVRTFILPGLKLRYSDTTPSEVTRLKKHPAMLRIIDEYVSRTTTQFESELRTALASTPPEAAGSILTEWNATEGRSLTQRLLAFGQRLGAARESPARAQLGTVTRLNLERGVRTTLERARDITGAWADLITDWKSVEEALDRLAPGAFRNAELGRIQAWCAARVNETLTEIEAQSSSDPPEPRRMRRAQAPPDADQELEPTLGVDGMLLDEGAALDREDDTLFLRLFQKLCGPLRRGTDRQPVVYEHMFIDEAQDLSPIELAVLLDTVSKGQSVTLAGDVAQRLHLDNGFTNWKEVLAALALSPVEIEPLKLSYRSTRQILDFSLTVLGPLAAEEPPSALRDGAPVELFCFSHTGDAVGFLSEALRELERAEPRASVAVIARYPEQADIYFEGLRRAEIAWARRVADQDFVFKPGIDVTDVRQVKGLEFDYVVLVEVSDAAYPADDEARHLLHIASTRAAHQLWILSTGRPSRLLPRELVSAAAIA
jgi:DNA helicase-2/ATP-dependent DNA helicase PcrA